MKTQTLAAAVATIAIALVSVLPGTAASHKSRGDSESIAVAQASDSAPKADDAKASDSASTTDEAKESGEASTGVAGAPLDTGFGSSVNINKMLFEQLNYDPNGDLLLTGQVDIQSDQFNIKGQTVNFIKAKKTIFAKGNPVVIEVPENNVKATGRTATYNVDTKQMVLEGDPIVNQYTPQDRTEIRGDIIMFTQGPNGRPGSMIVKMKPGSNRLPSFQKFPLKGSASAKKSAAEKAKPVKRNNTGIIPQLESGS